MIVGIVERAINQLIRTEQKIHFPGEGLGRSPASREQFQTCTTTLYADSGMLNIDFTFLREKRSLKLFVACDSDRVKYGPQSVSATLGCFGHSTLFMKTVAHALSLLGPAYFDANDSDDVDEAPLDETPPSLLDAVKLGYIRTTAIDHWLLAWDQGQFAQDGLTAGRFFGCPEAVFRELVGRADYQSAWDELDALASAKKPMLSFLEDFHHESAEASA